MSVRVYFEIHKYTSAVLLLYYWNFPKFRNGCDVSFIYLINLYQEIIESVTNETEVKKKTIKGTMLLLIFFADLLVSYLAL